MTEWLFTFVVLAFPSLNDAQMIAGNALILTAEAGEEGCKKADAIVRKKFEGLWVMTTCDPIKPSIVPLEMKRGNKT